MLVDGPVGYYTRSHTLQAIDRCLTALLESDKQWLSACQTPVVDPWAVAGF